MSLALMCLIYFVEKKMEVAERSEGVIHVMTISTEVAPPRASESEEFQLEPGDTSNSRLLDLKPTSEASTSNYRHRIFLNYF